MTKKGVQSFIIFILVLGIIVLAAIAIIRPQSMLDGLAASQTPHTAVQHGSAVECGNDKCESGEDYYNCPSDCCAGENYQANQPSHCCSGLNAVQDTCERTPVVIPPGNQPPETLPIQPPTTGAAVSGQQPSIQPTCYFCVKCGDKLCGKHENADNCPIDCLNCSGQGFRGPSPVTCCAGLIAIDPCKDVEPVPSFCTLGMQQQACIKCGDAKCDLYETPVNCPDDCLQNVTDCSQLPNIDAVIGTSDPNDIVLRFNWKKEIRDGPKIFLQRSDKCIGTECGFAEEPIEPLRNATNESEGRIEIQSTKDIEFFRIISKIKIGAGTCQPKCLASCGMLQVSGWCDECEGKLLKGADCSNIEPGVTGNVASQPPGINPPGAQCCFTDPGSKKSQGWYDISCSKATNANLIVFDSKCHLGAQMCEQASDILVKHTQHFIISNQKTSINWFVNDLGITKSEDLIRLDSSESIFFDYVAEWNPVTQNQTGSAVGNYGMKMCSENGCDYVVTGSFPMTDNMPYFVSLKAPHDLTYADSIPEHVIFNLVGNTNGADNYIVLPVDTRFKTAKQFCDELGLGDDATISIWDPNEQIPDPYAQCRVATFNIYPGKVYLVGDLRHNVKWMQE